MHIWPRRANRLLILLMSLLVTSMTHVPEALALKPLRGYPARPSDYGIICQEVTFLTPDSLRLVGWFYPAQDTAGIANELVGRVVPVPEDLRRPPRPFPPADERRPTIIICDGDGGNMADLIFYAHSLFPRGFNILTFDWRGFGESSEWPMDPDRLCCTEFLSDYAAAIDCVKARPEVDSNRIALMGFSTGAYLSFAMLGVRHDIAAFAGRALLTSFDDILPIIRRLDPKRNWRPPENYPPDLLPIQVARNTRVPVFLAVGETDPRTPPWMSEKIIAQLEGPKSLWIVPGAGHGGPSAPELHDYPEFFDRVAAFFTEQMKRL